MAGESIPADLRYSKEHEWGRPALSGAEGVEGKTGTIGITDHAQNALGDVVFVELPEAGRSFKQNEVFGVIESVKAASDCFLPVSGKVVEANSALADAPQELNKEPYGKGWLVKIELADAAELDSLMDAAAYAEFLKQQK